MRSCVPKRYPPHRRRGAKSFVDDLGLSRGVVLSRAAASLRSIETKPFDSKICPLQTDTSCGSKASSRHTAGPLSLFLRELGERPFFFGTENFGCDSFKVQGAKQGTPPKKNPPSVGVSPPFLFGGERWMRFLPGHIFGFLGGLGCVGGKRRRVALHTATGLMRFLQAHNLGLCLSLRSRWQIGWASRRPLRPIGCAPAPDSH